MKTASKIKKKAQVSESSVMVRLDKKSKLLLKKAAALRKISVSDYVRALVVTQARRDVDGDHGRTILMSPEGQVAFWEALNAPVKLTPKQQELGRIMRSEL